MKPSKPFWEAKGLAELSEEEWESLCDGCAKCCLRKLEDEDTGEIHYTDVACRELDISSCRCKSYARRFEVVADCVQVTPRALQAGEPASESTAGCGATGCGATGLGERRGEAAAKPARDDPGALRWMPSTCAYRLLAEGKPLPWWHPLVSGDPETVHRAGISVRGRVTSERHVHDSELEERIVEWPK